MHEISVIPLAIEAFCLSVKRLNLRIFAIKKITAGSFRKAFAGITTPNSLVVLTCPSGR